MGKYFGTDGFRGEANVTLTVEDAYKVGRFLGWYYGQKTKADRCRVVIGKDTRRSSYMFEYSLVSGLTASGADVYLLHVTTTPSVSYVVRTEEFDCGIMISASHNPYYDNGIKVINGRGEKLEEETIEKIESYLDGEMGEIQFAKRDAIGRTVDYAAGRNRYIGYLISLATRSFKNMRVGLDCANGSASAIAKNVFDALGAETHVINNTPDGLNINTNCGSTHIGGLQKYVVENHLDVGFAYDGDADRCLAVDSEGKLVDGDKILYVCGKYMKEQGTLVNNTVVTTVMSNFGLYKAFEREGISYEKTAVGDYSYYLEKRQERIDNARAEIARANNLYRKELDWMRRQPQARGHKARYREEAFYDLEAKARHALHAQSLGFVHPITHEAVYFESELPDDFRALLEKWDTPRFLDVAVWHSLS